MDNRSIRDKLKWRTTYITFAQICDGKNEFTSIIGVSCFITLIYGDNIATMIAAHVELIDNVKNDIYIFFFYANQLELTMVSIGAQYFMCTCFDWLFAKHCLRWFSLPLNFKITPKRSIDR